MTPKAAPRGRPREFDPDLALDRALRVFWSKGYDGASLSDLTEAMGINRPSLYAAFGNKEELFRRAVERYVSGPAGYLEAALQEPTARAVVQCTLQGAIDLLADADNPAGCLLVQGALPCGPENEAAHRELLSRRLAGVDELRLRFQRAVAEGDLPPDTDPSALADFVVTVGWGLAVQARTGATREDLQHVAALAMRAVP